MLFLVGRHVAEVACLSVVPRVVRERDEPAPPVEPPTERALIASPESAAGRPVLIDRDELSKVETEMVLGAADK
jgi:hypothetical protein